MLSDEEKEVVEWLKQSINEYNDIFQGKIEDESGIKRMKTIKNLIEKQSKEIEEYKKQLDLDYVDKHFVPVERYNQLEKEIEELRVESEQKEKQAYIDGANATDKLCNKKWEDKIKAKIEEIKEEKRHYLEINDEYNAQICDCIIEEYESLLEKE